MSEEMDEREVHALGQEAAIAMQNRAFIRVCEEMSQDAMDKLVECDPTDFKAVSICQLRLQAVAEMAMQLEAMAERSNRLHLMRQEEILEEQRAKRKGLN